MSGLERKIEMAKPGIPIEKPEKREEPLFPRPIPERIPIIIPVKEPSQPVPVKS